MKIKKIVFFCFYSVRTITQSSHLYLAEVMAWCHGDGEGTLGNRISSVGEGHSQNTLLDRGVLDRMGVIGVVDDLKVLDRLSFSRAGEHSVQLGFTCSLGVYCEVGRLGQLHTWREGREAMEQGRVSYLVDEMVSVYRVCRVYRVCVAHHYG